MSKLPSDIYTFLFTDIEGSTKLSQEYPKDLPAALEKHNSILRTSVESNNGIVFEIVGDAFCCAFEKAEDAVIAAVDAQTKLTDEKWGGAVIKVRMGIHSGEAQQTGKKFTGYITLARAARVMSIAYGGQIVISKVTHDLISDIFISKEKHDIKFRDLGERRLKDLIQPIQIYQVLSKGLRSEFPPLLTLDARPNNLPVKLTSFIGRDKEMEKVKELVSQSHLLTLMGSGGAGKSRLALQAGAELIDNFSGGVWIVELAQLSEPSFILPEIASSLNISLDSKKGIMEVVLDFFREKELLLILDNCEHLIDECASIINTLLRSCKKLKIIASSREALRITGETTYRVPSFQLPDIKRSATARAVSEYEVVKLFADRASAIKNDFKITDANAVTIAKLCYQLDGIPLAIELAAARIKVLSVEDIYEKLSNRFTLLTGGNRTALPRQKTLRAMIDWSYDLLSSKEKLLFERLTVFSGGWTLEHAEEICSDDNIDNYEVLDLISNLVDKSILTVIESGDENRFNMLETIRHYGSEKFNSSSEVNIIRKKHFDTFSRFMENSEMKLGGADQKRWVEKYESEIDNIRESLKWAISNEPDSALKLMLELAFFLDTKYYYNEGLEYLNSILEKDLDHDKRSYLTALRWKGNFLKQTGKVDEAKEILNKAGESFSETGDIKGNADVLGILGLIAFEEGDYDIAKEYLDRSLKLYEELKDNKGIAFTHYIQGGIYYMQTDYAEAKKIIEESLSLYRDMKNLKQIGILIGNLGTVEFQLGNFQNALDHYHEYLSISRELGNKKGITYALLNISYIHNQEKNYLKAKELQEESLETGKEIGNKNMIALSLMSIASTNHKLGNYEISKELFIESLLMFEELKDKYQIVECILLLSEAYCSLKEHGRSAVLLSSVDSLYRILNIQMNKINTEEYESILAELKKELSENEFERNWLKGQKATFENIIDIAVKEPVF